MKVLENNKKSGKSFDEVIVDVRKNKAIMTKLRQEVPAVKKSITKQSLKSEKVTIKFSDYTEFEDFHFSSSTRSCKISLTHSSIAPRTRRMR